MRNTIFVLEKTSKTVNIGSGNRINLIDLVKQIKNKYSFNTKLTLKKEYPGLFANISLSEN